MPSSVSRVAIQPAGSLVVMPGGISMTFGHLGLFLSGVN